MRNYEKLFKCSYILGAIIFLTVQVIFGGVIYKNLNGEGKSFFALYISMNFIVAILFVYVLKIIIRKVFSQINVILDKAIATNQVEEINEETEVAAIATKFTKYVRVNEEKREQAVKSKEEYEQLISNISHQTKIPLSNILIFAELLKEKTESEENSLYIENIVGQAEKLRWLIQSFVNMSRLESGIIQYHIKKYKIQELLAAALTGVYADAEMRQIRMVVHGNTECEGWFDLKWTAEAIINVLGNSIKYSAIHSVIDIDVEELSHYIRIIVKDYGIGIPSSEIPAVFSRLYRGKNAGTYDGIGIGLYLTREILTKQGGYTVISQGESVGSKVKLYLPKK